MFSSKKETSILLFPPISLKRWFLSEDPAKPPARIRFLGTRRASFKFFSIKIGIRIHFLVLIMDNGKRICGYIKQKRPSAEHDI